MKNYQSVDPTKVKHNLTHSLMYVFNWMLVITSLVVLFATNVKGQSMIGFTEKAVRNEYNDNTFKTGYATDGSKYIYTDMSYGQFTFYFDKETGLSDLCIQEPSNNVSMNALVENYNRKYVIKSETSWAAYLENGENIYIYLLYSKTTKVRYFAYTAKKY